MGVLLVPYSARGHVGPFLAVASELVRRGAQVRMVVAARYAPAVRAAGVVPVVAGSDRGARVSPGWGPADVADRAVAAAQRRSTARAVRQACVTEFAEHPPDLVVVDPHARWIRTLPAVSRRRSAWLWTTSPTSAAGDAPLLVNGLRQFGTSPRLSGRIRFIGPLLGGLRTVVPDFPFDRLVGRRVLVGSFGTVFVRRPRWLRAVAEAFRGSDWTVVLATGSVPVAALGPLPDNVLAYRGIPQQDLLRHADALLTHGGMNSVLEAAHAGVPMLVRPRSREQRRTARGVAALGAGALLNRVHDLRSELERLVGNAGTAARVHELNRLVRGAPTVTEAADQILHLADPRRMV